MAKPERAAPPPSRTKPKTQMDVEHAFKRRDWNGDWMWRLRELCLSFPEAAEVEQFGGPWYKAGGVKGKAFCLYGADSEKVGNGYRGRDGAGFNMTLMDQAALLEDPRFERPHYIGQHGWVTMRWDRAPDWAEVRDLVASAYRKVANKRMLKALDEAA
jgi:predicted DNA-binding protein (MmcQ/YjbR family)